MRFGIVTLYLDNGTDTPYLNKHNNESGTTIISKTSLQ